MDKIEYQSIDARFRSIFDRYAVQLSKECREGVLGTAGETNVKVVVRPGTTEVITAYPWR